MKRSLLVIALLGLSVQAQAETLDEIFKYFNPQGAAAFNAEQGKKLWTSQHVDKDGKTRECGVCHGKDLTKPGKHIKTKKVIDPLARSANPERFTELKKVKKWFKRNCKWTLGRECTNQEKGDVLKYLTQF